MSNPLCLFQRTEIEENDIVDVPVILMPDPMPGVIYSFYRALFCPDSVFEVIIPLSGRVCLLASIMMLTGIK